VLQCRGPYTKHAVPALLVVDVDVVVCPVLYDRVVLVLLKELLQKQDEPLRGRQEHARIAAHVLSSASAAIKQAGTFSSAYRSGGARVFLKPAFVYRGIHFFCST
jgi:hypothetical protein